MKKLRMIAVALLTPGILFAQQAAEASSTFNKMTTGLSMALIIVLALLIYTLIEKSKLHKVNQALSNRIKELEK